VIVCLLEKNNLIMKYTILKLLLISCLFAFDIDNWTYFKKTGSIDSIIEGDQLVHFVTDNGIYSYNDIEDKYYYNFNLSSQIDFNSRINHFYFDSNTSMYWLIDQYGIKTKHSFHDFWNEISYRKFNIIDINEIINIGRSSNYIWIKLIDRVIPLDPITGYMIDNDIDYNEINNIVWSSQYDNYGYNLNIDLSEYVIFDDWDIQRNKIVNNRGDILVPTSFIEDHSGNIWVGTNKGIILKGSSYSHRLEVVDFGLKFSNVTVATLDKDMNWWFGDSQFLRTGIKRNKQNFRKNSYDFLSKYNEYENKWEYIETDFSMLIQNIDVNDIMSVNDIIYIATMEGLLIFDEFNNDWVKVDVNLYDMAIWDIEYYEDSIYIATARGFDEFSILSNQIVQDEDTLSKTLRNSEIYDILIVDKIIYIASEKGLFKKYLGIDTHQILSDRKFKKIEIYEDSIFASDGDLWKINLSDLKIDRFSPDVFSFSISKDLIWLNHFNYCELVNINTYNSWDFDYQIGRVGLVIYDIESNDERVWFMTNNGVAVYKWDQDDYE